MARTAVRLALAVGIAFSVTPGYAQDSASTGAPEKTPFRTANAAVEASLARLASGSGLWREAMESVRKTGRHAVVLTSDQVLVADAPGVPAKDAFDPTVLAEAAPALRDDHQVHVVVVVVNLALLEETHRQRGSLPGELHADLDRILVHEIYGHAVPYLLAGDLSGRCPDPQPGQRALDACSIRRENAVRAEVGLGRRTTYGLDGLALRRGLRR